MEDMSKMMGSQIALAAMLVVLNAIFQIPLSIFLVELAIGIVIAPFLIEML